jgi:hypothetical protein
MREVKKPESWEEEFESKYGHLLLETKNEHGNKEMVNVSGWVKEYICNQKAASVRETLEVVRAGMEVLRRKCFDCGEIKTVHSHLDYPDHTREDVAHNAALENVRTLLDELSANPKDL